MTEDVIDPDIYAGAEPMEDEDLSAVDRGDSIEPEALEAEAPAAEPEAEPEAPVAEEPEAEPEPKDEAPAEEPEAEPEPEPQPQKRDNGMIPRSRFNDVNERRKAAEQRAQALEQQINSLKSPPAANFDFDAKEKEYMEHVIDGKLDEANAIRNEIRAAERDYYRQEATQLKQEAAQYTQHEMDFKQTVAELESAYPAFNPNNEETYDTEATQEALELHQAFMQTGRYASPASSLRAAVELVAVKNGLAPTEAESPAEEAPKPAPSKKQTAMKKAKEAIAETQPPIPGSGSAGTPAAIDVLKISEDEFDALPESKKAELRGDFV